MEPKRRWTLFNFVAVVVLVSLFFWTQVRLGGDTRPNGSIEDIAALRDRDDVNVLFLLIDTLRADRLGAYGYERLTTSTLDALSETGVRFARHMSQSSWTKTSMASVWTGLYPARTGILRFSHAIPEQAKLPAEILQAAGFKTVGLWRNGWVSPNFGFGQGFDLYHRPIPGRVVGENRRTDNPEARLQGSDADNTKAAIEFIRSNREDRWLLYAHYMDVHQYTSDEESAIFGTTYSDFYDNALHWTDRQIKLLVEALDEFGVRDRTLIIIASDHGEAFGEHGNEGHAKDLYTEVTGTPWIMSFPIRLDGGIVVEAPSQNVDLWPTILDLLGTDSLPDPDGRSLRGAILEAGQSSSPEAKAPPAAVRIAHLDQHWGLTRLAYDPVVSVTEGSDRLIAYPVGGRGDRPRANELYDLAQDPLEQRDLVVSAPERASRLRARVNEYLGSRPNPWGAAALEVEVDEMQRGQLRALGYVIE